MPLLLVAVMLALILILLCAFKVRLVALPQVTSALTLMSPFSAPVATVCKVILVLAKLFCRVVAPIPLSVFSAVPELILKSVGSISHSPVLPLSDKVETFVPSVILTFAALVSINPPSAPFFPSAFSIPLILVSPNCMSPKRMISPLAF